jgi:FdhE protein
MPRTASGLRTDPPARLAELERQRPEWKVWVRSLREAERALDDPRWRTPLAETELAVGRADAHSDAPLLNGRTLQADGGQVQRLIRRLTAAVSGSGVEGGTSLRRYRPSADQAVGLIAAAVRQESGEMAALADAAGVEAGALSSIAHLAALPLLHSCGRLLADWVPGYWPHGYCPICAAWPILAELRGLDRSRRLRCGRCGAQWEVQWLYCVYCGERNHQRLGSLVPEGGGETLKVETCATCRGYLKSIASLQGFPAFELLLQDLETVEFDLVALERGYCRPPEPGFTLDVEIVDRASCRDL